MQLFKPCFEALTGPFIRSSLSGWISALTCLNTSIAVGIIMILIAGLFTALAVMSLIMFKKVGNSCSSTSTSGTFFPEALVE